MPTAMIRIQRARQAVAARIREVEKQLREAERLPDSQPWLSLRRVSDVRELRSPHRSLREALKSDLAELRSQLRHLRRQEAVEHRRAVRGHAAQLEQEFTKRAKQKLREAERKGFLDDETAYELRGEAEAVLEAWVEALEHTGSREDMKHTLDGLENALIFGSDADDGPSARAFTALERASHTLADRARRRFRGAPTTQNFKHYLDDVATNQLLGGEGLAVEVPVLHKRSDVASHVVARGDTLAKLAKDIYGDAGYWDVIFLANVGRVEHPEKLEVGTELVIP